MSSAVGSAQDIGDRPEQQDAWAFSPLRRERRGLPFVGVVADGMGGMKNGAEAARTAVEVFMREYHASPQSESIPKAMERAMFAANAAVYSLGRQANMEGEIAATLVAAAVEERKLYWISVGDSRAYLLRGGALFRLTVDHVLGTELDDQAANGTITWQDALNHSGREHVTRCMGMPQNPIPDCSLDPLPLAPDDTVILCSDGIYRALTENEIAACCSGVDPQTGCDRVREAVKSRRIPDQDNCTVLAMIPPSVKRSRLRRWPLWLVAFFALDVALLYYFVAVLLRDLYRTLRFAVSANGTLAAVWKRGVSGAHNYWT